MSPLLLALVLAPTPVGPRFELGWQAPEGCPDRAQIEAAVTLQLDRAPGQTTDPIVQAAIAITRADADWHARIELVVDGTGGVRELHAESCETLASACAFVIAATIDPAVQLRPTDFTALPRADQLWLEQQDDRLRTPEPRRATASMLPHHPHVAPATTRPPSTRVGVGAAAVLAVGPLPGVAGGIAGALAVLGRRYRIELGATFLPAKTARFDVEPSAGGELRLLAADLRGCPSWRWRALALDACVGVQAGVVHGRGFGIDRPARTRQPWLAFTLGPRLSYAPIRWLALGLGADLLVPVVRPSFTVAGLGRLWRPRPAGFLGMLGVEVRLP